MSEMIERVARSIFNSHPSDGVVRLWGVLSEDGKETYSGFARAAIEAMREPTEKMKEALVSAEHVESIDWVSALHDTGISSAQDVVVCAYHAMIDAALND